MLPVRRDVNFGYFGLDRLKTKMLEGPIQTNRLVIGGYKSGYYPLSDFPHSSESKNSRNTPVECLPLENEKSFRCDFIKPEFTLTFRDASNHKILKGIRIQTLFARLKSLRLLKRNGVNRKRKMKSLNICFSD